MVFTFKNNPARTAALASGQTTYRGHTCRRCETADRYTSSGACIACTKTRAVQHGGSAQTRYRPSEDSARGAALTAGEKTYVGPPCRTCTSTERYTSSGGCVHCAKAAVTQRGDGRPRRKYEHHEKHGLSVPLQPADGKCQACGEIAKLIIDHDHVLEALGFPGSETFRGWVCYRCNSGIGRLGDNIAGVQRALDYLTRRRP